MSIRRGQIEDTEGVNEPEFIVLDYIKSTPNATVPEIARLIDDVGADLGFIADTLGIDRNEAQAAYDQVFASAPPIEEVIQKQVDASPVVPPKAPLDKVIEVATPDVNVPEKREGSRRDVDIYDLVNEMESKFPGMDMNNLTEEQKLTVRELINSGIYGSLSMADATGVFGDLTARGTDWNSLYESQGALAVFDEMRRQGLNYEDLSRQTGVPVETISSIIDTARQAEADQIGSGAGAGGSPEPSKIGNLLGRIFGNENSVAPGLQRVNLTDDELQSAISQILDRTKYSDVDTISSAMRRLGDFVANPSSTVQNYISAATGIPVSAGLFQPEGYGEYISQAQIARNRGQEFTGLDGTFGQTVGAGGGNQPSDFDINLNEFTRGGNAGFPLTPQTPSQTVPDVNDPNLRRNVQTGAMAGAQLPVGLAAAEQAALGGAGRATGLLGTTAGAAGRELTAGTLGGIGALRGGIGQARQDIMQGTQTGIGALQQALGGARADIESGFAGGRGDIQQALAQSRGDIQSGFGRAEAMFDPYAQAGGQALQQQLALSGALGQEAFQQAYQESPQMQFLREQGERAALRTAAARGGLGGGRVMQELARYGTGLASQDLQNQIANLQALSAQGLGARGTAANIATGGAQQLAGLAAGAGQNLSNISTGQAQQLANLGVLGGTSGLQAATQQGTQLANLAQQLGVRESDLLTGLGAGRSNIALGIGTRAADLAAQTGLNVAGMRTRAGEQLAGQFGTAASQLADLQQAQGAGTASMIGAQTNYMNQLQQAAAAGDAQAQTQLAQLQANINMGIGSNLAGVPAAQFTPLPNPAGSIFQGAALGYQLGQGFTPTTQGGAPVSTSQPAYVAPTQQAPFVNLQTGTAFT